MAEYPRRSVISFVILPLLMLVAWPLSAIADDVSCDSDYGSLTLRDGSASYQCTSGDGGDMGGGDLPEPTPENCQQLLADLCGSADSGCDGSPQVSCNNARGACVDYGGSFLCQCYDGQATDCQSLSASEDRGWGCMETLEATCDFTDILETCDGFKGTCNIYPAGFLCLCEDRSFAGLSNFNNPRQAASYTEEHGCEEILDTFCLETDAPDCTPEGEVFCQRFHDWSLGCFNSGVFNWIGMAQCCDEERADSERTTAFYDCMMNEPCDTAEDTCAARFASDDTGDGDTGDLEDGDTADGDVVTGDSEDDATDDGAAGADDSENDNNLQISNEIGDCNQADIPLSSLLLLVMVTLILRFRSKGEQP